MAITIVATVGSATANSFVTEAEAIAYLAARLNLTGWATITGSTCTEDEKAAMVEATRDISLAQFLGERTDAVQALSWPRVDVLDPDNPLEEDFDDDVLPIRVKRATIELAHEYLRAGTTDIASISSTATVIRKRIDVIETEWAEPSLRPQGLARFPRVMSYLMPLLKTPSGLTVARS